MVKYPFAPLAGACIDGLNSLTPRTGMENEPLNWLWRGVAAWPVRFHGGYVTIVTLLLLLLLLLLSRTRLRTMGLGGQMA
ncbi:hypothetical protein BDV19DRAFT_238327 [Aspergillus venezuelensis]